jgi:S1-C subfamily serine protease
MRQLIATGRVSYAYVGISTDDLTPAVARRIEAGAQRGALVTRVDDGPGCDAGLRAGTRVLDVNGREVQAGGDVVVAISGRPVRSADDLVRIVGSDLLPGQIVTFSIVRGERRLDVPVRLSERPSDPPDDEGVSSRCSR